MGNVGLLWCLYLLDAHLMITVHQMRPVLIEYVGILVTVVRMPTVLSKTTVQFALVKKDMMGIPTLVAMLLDAAQTLNVILGKLV